MADISKTLQRQVQEAVATQRRLRICGARSKSWMAAASGDRLSVAEHCGIVRYNPAELVVVVRAGTPLQQLDAVLAEQQQMLAMESPDFNGNSTIGGAVALGWSGSRAPFAGGLRDSVLGVRLLNGLGEDLQFGGEVMKNVAGFDVSRLCVGSAGRLGVLLDISLKVMPRPIAEITLVWDVSGLEESRRWIAEWTAQGLPVSAAALEQGRFRVRFSGSPQVLEPLQAGLGGEPEDMRYWEELRRLQRPLFHHGWGDEKLFDGNGQYCWTAHSRQAGDAPPVSLSSGPEWQRAGNAALLQRVSEAFDPQQVFAEATN